MDRQLIIVDGPEKDRTFPLEDGQTLIIGRGPASHTRISDPHMSRVHCRVQVDGGKTVLLDEDSTSGTLVRGQRVERVQLQPGDEFQIGDSRLCYLLGEG